jgi:CDP-diacylglycerol--glycerol-3-phosphate 3-phosphatidyltransferase
VSGSVVSPALRERVRGIATPVAVGVGRLGLTPNHLTLIGFGVAIVVAVAVAQGGWMAGAILLIVGGVFDLFDGALARATGQATRLGAFMDSVFDRAGEGIVYLGIVVGAAIDEHTRVPILATAAMGSAFMVSYVRARSEGLGFTTGSGMAAVGLMPREVRLVILSIGLIFADSPNIKALEATLAIITIGATLTVIQRILHVRAQAKRESTSLPTEQEQM